MTITDTVGPASPAMDDISSDDPVDVAARHMYEAEIALHCARRTDVDAWIAAAYERLHEAVLEHAAAVAERTDAAGTSVTTIRSCPNSARDPRGRRP